MAPRVSNNIGEAGQPKDWGMQHPDYGPARGSNLPPLQKLPPNPNGRQNHPSKETPNLRAKPGKTKKTKAPKGMKKVKSLTSKVPTGGMNPPNIVRKKTQKKPKER